MKQTFKLMASAVAAVALFFSTTVNAQSTPKLGVGVNLGVPTNDFNDLAAGVDLRYQFDLDRQLSVPITAGYTHFFGKKIPNTDMHYSSYGYIPVKAGLKYFFNDTGSGAYGLAEAGAGFGTGNASGTVFTYSPALGYAWSNGLDLGAKYEGYTKNGGNMGYVGLRLAYGFKL